MGRSQRRKGHNFEREVAAELRACAPMIADRIRRGLQSRDGSTVPDVMTPWPIHVECKVGARPNVGAAMRQALLGAGAWVGARPHGGAAVPLVRDLRSSSEIARAYAGVGLLGLVLVLSAEWVDLRRM